MGPGASVIGLCGVGGSGIVPLVDHRIHFFWGGDQGLLEALDLDLWL